MYIQIYNKHTLVVCLCKGGGGGALMFSWGLETLCISRVDFNKSILGLLLALPCDRDNSTQVLFRRLLFVLNSSRREPLSKDVSDPRWLNLIIRLNRSALCIFSLIVISRSFSSWFSLSISSMSAIVFSGLFLNVSWFTSSWLVKVKRC